MQVNKSQKRLLIILSLVVSYAVYDFIQNKDNYTKMYLGKGDVTKAESSNQVKLKSNIQTTQTTKIEFDWKKDPFYRDDLVKKIDKKKKSRKPRPKARRLKLQAITYSAENSFVMINDLILSEGEYVDGYRVEKIERTRVKLKKNGRVIYLSSK